jgi:hypothetical protein
MRSYGVEFHPWRQFKRERDLFPYLRFGWVTIWCCHGSIMEQLIAATERIEVYRRNLTEAASELTRCKGN